MNVDRAAPTEVSRPAAKARGPSVAIWLAVLTLTVTPLGVVPASAAPQRSRTLISETCRFPLVPEAAAVTRCFRLTVPRNYQRPSDGTFDLAVAVQRPAAQIKGRRPVLMLHGGPGGSGFVRSMGRRVAIFSPGAVIVTFDQRGNGLSEPAICNDIPLVIREAIAAPGDGFSTIWRVNEPYARCRARMNGTGVKPEHFGTSVTSRDADELRRALGFSKWDIWSVSYGTIVALDMMAAQPATIGSVVLDSPVGLVPQPETASAEFERPVLNIFAACAAHPRCRAAYPRLKEEFYDTLRGLDRNPLVVPLDPSTTGGIAQADLNGLEFEFLLRRLMRSAAGIGSIPRALEAARQRNSAALEPLVTNALAAVPETNTMARPAVMCRDQPELSEMRPPSRGWDFGQLFGVCRLWGEPGPVARRPEVSRSPVLIMVGELDPYYEPEVVRSIEARLGGRSRTIFFPAATHGVFSRGCSSNIVANFFANPQAATDTECVEAMPAINFLVGGPVQVTP